MDSRLEQEALKNPDIKGWLKRNTQMVTDLHVCLGALPGSEETFV